MCQNTEYFKKLQDGLAYQDFITQKLLQYGIVLLPYNSLINQIKKGENMAGFEIKHDLRWHGEVVSFDTHKNISVVYNEEKATGNLFIETSEKTNADNLNYINSGIFRNDNSFMYIIGDYSKFFIFAKKDLLNAFNAKDIKSIDGKNYSSIKYERKNIATANGFLISEKEAENIALKTICMIKIK